MVKKGMVRACLVLASALLLLCVNAGAANLTTGVQIGSSNGTGYYEIFFWDVNYTTLTINTTNINISGVAAGTDFFGTVSNLICNNVTECVMPGINTNEYLVGHDFISTNGSLNLYNLTGNLTNFTVCYNTTAQGNITFMMDDLGDDCNYGVFNLTGYNHTVYLVYFDRSLLAYTECSVRIEMNATATGNTCFRLYEDESMSEISLATILAAAGITITLISHGYKWDTVS